MAVPRERDQLTPDRPVCPLLGEDLLRFNPRATGTAPALRSMLTALGRGKTTERWRAEMTLIDRHEQAAGDRALAGLERPQFRSRGSGRRASEGLRRVHAAGLPGAPLSRTGSDRRDTLAFPKSRLRIVRPRTSSRTKQPKTQPYPISIDPVPILTLFHSMLGLDPPVDPGGDRPEEPESSAPSQRANFNPGSSAGAPVALKTK